VTPTRHRDRDAPQRERTLRCPARGEPGHTPGAPILTRAGPAFHALRRDRWGAMVVATVVFVSAVPFLAGYVRAPAGWIFTGAPTYAEDVAQHEAWATQMADHGRYLVNVLTPEPTADGWFVNPFELLVGLVQAGTGIPYPILALAIAFMATPALAWGLLTLARRMGIRRPAIAVLVALLAGSLAPLGIALGKVGLPGDKALWVSYGGDATPIAGGGWLYLALAVLTLLALLHADVVSGFRRAGATLFALGTFYPFLVPVLWLTGGLYGAVVLRSVGRRTVVTGLVWFSVLSLPPAIYYGLLLPHIDPEFARFARLNHRPIATPATAVVSFGLAGAAVAGAGRLLRGNRAQQLMACLALALVVAFYVPSYPWRSHLLLLSPVLVLGAIAAWWPVVRALDWRLRAAVVVIVLGVTLPSVPYYYLRNVRGLMRVTPPQYLTAGDVAAMDWLARDRARTAVLARSDISPWVAVRTGHRVFVGHYLWTHDWSTRRDDVDAIFASRRSPGPLLETFHVQWILIDTERGTPTWAAGVQPASRFGTTTILRAADVLDRLSSG
jgi:hypothetical protein